MNDYIKNDDVERLIETMMKEFANKIAQKKNNLWENLFIIYVLCWKIMKSRSRFLQQIFKDFKKSCFEIHEPNYYIQWFIQNN